MKSMSRHTTWLVPVFGFVSMLAACSRGTGAADGPSGSGATVTLVLNTEVLGSARSGAAGGFPDKEKMKTLRIVVLHPDGTVEHNRFLDFGEVMQTECTRLVEVKRNEVKSVYLIANEGSVPGLDRMELDDFVQGAAGFKDKADNLSFVPDYTDRSIPMSSVYEVAIGDKSKECRLCLVRTATKFTFRFRNMRSGAVAVNSIAVSEIARSTFLMPRKKNPMMTFEEADGSRSELFWIDWLKRVAEESLETPDDKELADKRGWITDYDIPAGAVSDSVVVAAPADFRVAGLVYDMGVPKPGEAVYPVFYLPESKSLKEPGTGAYGEQAYTMAFELTDDNNAKRKFSRPFDNLKALFRNTHVVVDVTFLEKGVQVDVIPYSEVILTPEFGL